MRIFVKAKPKSKEAFVEKIDDSHFVVAVKEPPIKGMANGAIIIALANYFKTNRLSVRIISGHTSREKIIEIA